VLRGPGDADTLRLLTCNPEITIIQKPRDLVNQELWTEGREWGDPRQRQMRGSWHLWKTRRRRRERTVIAHAGGIPEPEDAATRLHEDMAVKQGK